MPNAPSSMNAWNRIAMWVGYAYLAGCGCGVIVELIDWVM